MATALYPGSFDPVTYGHLDVVRRGVALFERVVVAVGRRHEKQTIFDADERVRLFREATAGMERVQVESFEGLVVDFARKTGASVLLRGLRTMSDFEYDNRHELSHCRQPNRKRSLKKAINRELSQGRLRDLNR